MSSTTAEARHAGAVPLLETAEGMYAADTLAVSIATLGVGDVIVGAITVDQLAAATGMTPTGAHVVVELLAAHGLVDRAADRIELTAAGRDYLPSASPYSLRPLYEPISRGPNARAIHAALVGRSPDIVADASPGDDWLAGMSELDFARFFLQSTDSRNRILADALTDSLHPSGGRLLDVGAGSGLYSIALLVRNPTLVATLLERPPVTQIALGNIQSAGLADRASVVPGDLFGDDPLPTGHTDVLLSNVLHDWNHTQVLEILSKCREALPTGGRLHIHDTLTGVEAPEGNRRTAEYSPLLLRFTQGCCHSWPDLQMSLASSGFDTATVRPTVAHRSLVTAVAGGHP